jgi:phosphatidate cytidylyltransferase
VNISLTLIVACLFGCGAALIGLTHWCKSSSALRRREDWLKYGVYAVIVICVLLAAYLSPWLLSLILAAVAFIGAFELGRALKDRTHHSVLLASLGGLLVAIALGHLLLGTGERWFASFAMVFLLVSISDSFAQLWGRLLGRHKLCPRLSPGKTWEGLIGGFLSALLGSLALPTLHADTSRLNVSIMAMIIFISAVVGDFLFSLIKRKLGIKDFSGLLPGHGGVFDRFDSLIIAAPAAFWFGRLIGW